MLQQTSDNNECKTENPNALETVTMFSLTRGEAPFLIGSKGRNISLIRKFSGMIISIRDQDVVMCKSKATSDVITAWRMVVSACYGGILRWFETPYATMKGYPENRVPEFEKIAKNYDCELQLLRSRRGHMCLMLIPRIILDNNDAINEEKRGQWADTIHSAREALLAALSVNHSH